MSSWARKFGKTRLTDRLCFAVSFPYLELELAALQLAGSGQKDSTHISLLRRLGQPQLRCPSASARLMETMVVKTTDCWRWPVTVVAVRNGVSNCLGSPLWRFDTSWKHDWCLHRHERKARSTDEAQLCLSASIESVRTCSTTPLLGHGGLEMHFNATNL